MNSSFWRRLVLVLGAILLFGAMRVPIENGTWERQKELGYRSEVEVPRELSEQLGQNAFAIALGGYRSVVATWFSLLAYDSWRNFAWDTLEQQFRIATTLQPQEEEYWRLGGWHLAFNATAQTQRRRDISLEQQNLLWRDYIDRGNQFFEDGVRQNPQSWRLWKEIGMLWRDRFKIIDADRSAEAFGKAAAIEGCPKYIRRFWAYQLAQSSSRENRKKALELAREFWQDEKNQTPAVLLMLYFLENEIGDPQQARPEWFAQSLEEIANLKERDRVLFIRDWMKRSNMENSVAGKELVRYYQELKSEN